jgi:hypothetical protein
VFSGFLWRAPAPLINALPPGLFWGFLLFTAATAEAVYVFSPPKIFHRNKRLKNSRNDFVLGECGKITSTLNTCEVAR